MKLLDLNYDCLEEIGRTLPFDDLLNIADSSKMLKDMADSVFKQKYGKHLCIVLDCSRGEEKISAKNDGNTSVNGWKNNFQTVRNFGHMISTLTFSMRGKPSNRNKKLIKRFFTYVNEYCGDSLIDIKLGGIPKDTLNHLPKPFPFVKKLHIEGYFNGKLLSQLFPNVHKIIFRYYSWKNFQNVGTQFQNLEYLVLWPQDKMKFREISEKSTYDSKIYSLLRSNPQLKSLALPVIPKANIRDKIINLMRMPIQFNQLEKLTLSFSSVAFDEFETFLMNNQTIKEIEIFGYIQTVLHIVGFGKNLATLLPELVSVDMGVLELIPDFVFDFVNQFKHLKVFKFRLKSDSNYDDYLKNPKNGWSCVKLNKKSNELTWYEAHRD